VPHLENFRLKVFRAVCALVGEEVGRRVLVPHRALEQFVRAPSDCNVP
jgi:hypothetical protein